MPESKDVKTTATDESTHTSLNPTDLDIGQESSLGDIKINNEVVANIVRIATREVAGVVAIAGVGGIGGRIEGIFSKREGNAGISVDTDDHDNYLIVVKVILSFGVELAKTAYEIQSTVRDQVSKMTNKKVARVDVIIDGVKMPEEGPEEFDVSE